MPRYHILGGAKDTTLTGTLDPTGLSFVIADPSGWPTGGANGQFWVIINPEKSNEEHLLAQSRSGNTITIASVSNRGMDGTPAGTHNPDSKVIHGFSAVQADDANAHQFDVLRDDHPQYHTAGRHGGVVHTSAMLGTDSVGSSQLQANSVGSSELATDAVDTASIQNLAVTGAKVAANTLDGSHIAPDSIGASELADASVALANMLANSVGTTQILDLNVTDGKIADATITGGKHLTTISTYTPTLTNVNLGTGGTNGAIYVKVGRLMRVWGAFVLGTGAADVTGEIIISLPPGAANEAYNPGVAGFCYVGPAQAFQNSVDRWAGTGLIKPDTTPTTIRGFGLFGQGSWDGNQPFDWSNAGSDRLNWHIEYITATV